MPWPQSGSRSAKGFSATASRADFPMWCIVRRYERRRTSKASHGNRDFHVDY